MGESDGLSAPIEAGLNSFTGSARQIFGESLEEVSGTQSDKRRLGVYYLIDWILGRGTVDFTLKDVLEASRRLSVKIALAEEIAPRVAEDILSVLVDSDYIQLAQKNLGRQEEQLKLGTISSRDLDQARSDFAQASAEYTRTQTRLKVLGVTPTRGQRSALLPVAAGRK